jgi:hypothetical protein
MAARALLRNGTSGKFEDWTFHGVKLLVVEIDD